MATAPRSEENARSRTSMPSSRTSPSSGSYSREIRLTRVDFPAPDLPTIPSISPGFTSKETFLSTGLFGS